MNTKNIDAAIAALIKEIGTEVYKDDLAAYLAKLDEVTAAVKAIREPHAKAIAVVRSQASRAKRTARVKEAMALLAEREAAEAAAAK